MRNYVYILFLFALTGLLYAPIIPDWLDLLNKDDNSHGFLVPFIVIYLIWQKRDSWKKSQIAPSNLGVLFLLFSLLLFFGGVVGGVEFLPRVSLVLAINSLLYFNLGKNVIKHIYFPLFFLFFIVPVPESFVGIVSLPLKMVAAKISTVSLTTIGIPVFREGNMLYFANASLEVADACSGIRSLISYLMLGSLFAYLMHTSLARKLFLVGLTVPFAFLTNLLRVTGTGLLAHFYGNKVAQGFLHEFSGMVTFLLGLLMIAATFQILQRGNKDD